MIDAHSPFLVSWSTPNDIWVACVYNPGLVTSFADFFENNVLDPNAIDSAYADQIPPTYSSTYDPDNGNIVRLPITALANTTCKKIVNWTKKEITFLFVILASG